MALRFAACIVCVWRIRLFVARHARAPRTSRTRRGPKLIDKKSFGAPCILVKRTRKSLKAAVTSAHPP